MYNILRNQQFLAIHEHWNGNRLVKTPEWVYYRTQAKYFGSTADAKKALAAIDGTLPEMETLIGPFSSIPIGCIPTDNIEIIN